jgi:hypothetical protein
MWKLRVEIHLRRSAKCDGHRTQGFLANNSYTKFHDNPTNGLAADTGSQAVGRGLLFCVEKKA